jgi:hypothetical protein
MYAYFMAAICGASGLLLILRMGREKKLYYALGAFLLVLGGWVFADKLTGGALSHSWAIWVQRTVLLVVIVALIVIMVRDVRSAKADGNGAEDDPLQEPEDSSETDENRDSAEDNTQKHGEPEDSSDHREPR